MKLFALLLVFFICQPHSEAQTIQIIPNIGFGSHSANISLTDLPDDPTVPSIGVFYQDAVVLGFRSLFLFDDIKVESSSFFAGVLYEHSEMQAVKNGIVLGEEFITNSIGFSFGYKSGSEKQFPKIFFTVSVEYLMNFCYGYTEYNPVIHSISKYSTQSTFRARAGLEYFNPESIPFIFGVSTYIGYGTIKRDNIDFYENDIYQDSLIPTGDLVLPDMTFGLSLDISYSFSL